MHVSNHWLANRSSVRTEQKRMQEHYQPQEDKLDIFSEYYTETWRAGGNRVTLFLIKLLEWSKGWWKIGAEGYWNTFLGPRCKRSNQGVCLISKPKPQVRVPTNVPLSQKPNISSQPLPTCQASSGLWYLFLILLPMKASCLLPHFAVPWTHENGDCLLQKVNHLICFLQSFLKVLQTRLGKAIKNFRPKYFWCKDVLATHGRLAKQLTLNHNWKSWSWC